MTTHDGLIVNDEALALAFRLENQGHTLTATNGQLTVTNKKALTAEDVAAIRKHRLQLLGICGYTTTIVP